VSASVKFPLHHKVQKFSSGTGSPGWSQKKGCKMVVCACVSACVRVCVCVCWYGGRPRPRRLCVRQGQAGFSRDGHEMSMAETEARPK